MLPEPPLDGGIKEPRWTSIHNDDLRRPGAVFLHQAEELGGVLGVQPDAAVGRRAAQRLDVGAAVDGVAAVEENRMGHRRHVVFARVIFLGHALDPVGSARRVIALAGR
jgi:hypothetical protein